MKVTNMEMKKVYEKPKQMKFGAADYFLLSQIPHILPSITRPTATENRPPDTFLPKKA